MNVGEIFKDFVEKCWQGRVNNPKPSVKNLLYKLIMNALTGKLAQRSKTTNTAVFSTEAKLTKQEKADFYELLKNASDFELFYDAKGRNHAVLLDYDCLDASPSYPIGLTAQILAYSRVQMSTILRACNGYLDPNRAFYYTDTDSLIVPSTVLPSLRAGNYLGNGLGQLSCDLTDSCTDFAKIVSGVWAAPKGPYAVAYLEKPGDTQIKEKIRSKGIPMPSDNKKGVFDYNERIDFKLQSLNECIFPKQESDREHLSLEQQESLKRLAQWIECPDAHLCPSELIGHRFYLWKSPIEKREGEEQEVFFAKHLNTELIWKAMQKEGEITCYYGGMERSMSSSTGELLQVCPTVNSRVPCKLDWWSERSGRLPFPSGVENVEPPNERYDLTVPAGYNPERRRVDIDYAQWLQLGVTDLF